MNLILTLFPLLCINYVSAANIRVDPLVLIGQGLVRGQKSSEGHYSKFLGIPYARVNASNPFGEAIEHEGFGDSVFNAYDGSVQCPQASGAHSTEGVVDCLTLNIYVPESANTNNPMPVLVWIHGGSFTEGSASIYDPKYLVRHGLVVVAINYRLGPYGFFCLDNPIIPGNQGLKDQLTALRWIKSNIASFGGNPYNVTLAGQSAGSISVEFQLYSSAEKLFHKVILQSGVAQTIGALVEGDREAPIKLAAYLGLNTTSTDRALEYLASSSPTLVTAAARDLNLLWRPCIEKSFSGVTNFITTDPVSMSNPKKLSGIPVMIGHTDRESQDSSTSISDNFFYEYLKDNFNLPEETLVTETDIIRHFYIGDKQISDSATAVGDFLSDLKFAHPTTRAVTKFLGEGAGPVYEYLFNYDKNGNGAAHSAELSYLFEIATTDTCCSTSADKTEEEILIRDRMTTLWANFAKSGNPTPSTSDLIPITWEAVSGDKRPYIVINSNLTIEHRIFHERMSLWDMFYSVYGDQSIYIKKCNL